MQQSIVMGVFSRVDIAGRAFMALYKAGFRKEQISVVREANFLPELQMSGRLLLSVKTEDVSRRFRAEGILEEAGAIEISVSGQYASDQRKKAV